MAAVCARLKMDESTTAVNAADDGVMRYLPLWGN